MESNQLLSKETDHLSDLQYETGDFLFASPSKHVLAKGRVASSDEVDVFNEKKNLLKSLQDLARQRGVSNPVVAGAVPFDQTRPARLIVPEFVQITSPIKAVQYNVISRISVKQLKPNPMPEDYKEAVKKGVRYIHDNQIDKIVLGRTLEIETSEPADEQKWLQRLAGVNPHGYTFAANIAKSAQSPKRVIIGASPELLVSKKGRKIKLNPLAGSRPRSPNPEEDQRLKLELSQSAKDLHEHNLVVKGIEQSLRPFCSTLSVPESPEILSTETMWHLSTVIEGVAKDPQMTSFDLAKAIHPTPAICGTPTAEAMERISEIEPFDRDFFTGIVGWCDADGDGEWAIIIRCAEVGDMNLRLFAGAGIVKDSKPEEELQETGAKFKTMLRALGIEDME